MAEQIKFCVDCAFCAPRPGYTDSYESLKYAKCLRPTPQVCGYTFISPEHAEKEKLEAASYCRTERELEHLCGPSAQFFQPKPPAPKVYPNGKVYPMDGSLKAEPVVEDGVVTGVVVTAGPKAKFVPE